MNVILLVRWHWSINSFGIILKRRVNVIKTDIILKMIASILYFSDVFILYDILKAKMFRMCW